MKGIIIIMKAVGMIETLSIPKGILAADAMLKAADVSLIFAQAVCAGKYIVLVSGDVAAVKAAVEAGEMMSQDSLVDSMMIPNVSEEVFSAINASSDIENTAALGIMETFSICTAMIVADAAVKAANVALIEIRLGRGLGGKSFVTLTGDVSACEAAINVAQNMEESQGMLSSSVVIPSPHKDIMEAIY
jgi:microcompartment protein CcmL/EutN